jgi:ribosomal protein S6
MMDERIEYELYYLVGELKEAALPKIREEVERIVKSFGGEFLPAETSEKRTLAYLVRKEKRGTYIARRFTLPGKSDEPFVEEKEPKEHAIFSIDRELKLYQDVSRFLILRADDLPELAPIVREEYPTAPRKAVRDHRTPFVRPMPSQPKPEVKKAEAVPTPVAPVVETPVVEAAAEEPAAKTVKKPKKEEQKELSKEELDKKLDDVLAGIE